MNGYNLLILVIIMIKIIYILLLLTKIYNKIYNLTDTLFGINVLFWLDRIEFIYTFLMAILIILLFKNAIRVGKICIYDKETITLMYVFGFILLFSANWKQFISDSFIIQNIQNMLGIKLKPVNTKVK